MAQYPKFHKALYTKQLMHRSTILKHIKNNRMYCEKRNKIIKFFLGTDSYVFLQIPTLTSYFLTIMKTWLPRQV